MGSERRQGRRIEVNWPISIETAGGSVQGTTMNLGLEGMSICCDDPLPLEEVVRITLRPPDRPPMRISGKVLWADLSAIDDQNRFVGMGLCFVEVSSEDRRYLVGLVEPHGG